MAIDHETAPEGVAGQPDPRFSAQRLHETLQASGLALWDYEIATDKLWLDPRFADFIGCQPADLPDTHTAWLSLVNQRDYTLVKECFTQYLLKQSPHFQGEYRILHRDGRWIWLQTCGVITAWGPDGAPLRLNGTHRDVTAYKQAEEELHEHSEHFRAIFELATLGVAQVSLDGHLLRCNSRWGQLLGYDPAELAGKLASELTPAEDLPREMELMGRAFANPQLSPSIPKRYICRDGSLLETRLTATLICDVHGQPLYLIEVIDDASMRRGAVQALGDRREQTQRFLDSSTDMVYLKDEEFSYVVANSALCEFFGVAESAVIGRTDSELMTPDAAQRCHETDLQALKNSDTVLSVEEIGEHIYETRKFAVKLASGHVGVGGIIRDVTIQRRAEETVRESEQHFRAAFEQTGVGIFHLSLKGTWLRVNAHFLELISCTWEELAGSSVWRLVAPEDTGALEAMYNRLVNNEVQRETLELRLVAKSGREIWTSLSLTMLRDLSGAPRYMIGVLEDITARKQAERILLAVMESTSRFTGTQFFADLTEKIAKSLGVCTALAGLCDPADPLQATTLAVFNAGKQEPNYSFRFQPREDPAPPPASDDPGVQCVLPASGPLAGCNPAGYLGIWLDTADDRRLGFLAVCSDAPLRLDPPPLALLRLFAIRAASEIEAMESEAALRLSEERYRTLVDNMSEGLTMADARVRYLFANRAAEQIFGVEPGGLAGRNLREFLAPDQAELLEDQVRRRAEGRQDPYEIGIQRADGERRTLLVTPSPQFDGSGKLLGSLALVQDVTESRRAAEALRISEERFQSLFANMGEGAALHELVMDSDNKPVDYRVIDCNSQYERILALKRSAVVGKLASAVYKTQSAPYLEIFARVATSGISERLETYYEPLGTHFEISVAPWGHLGFATLFSDITSRKNQEAQIRQLNLSLESRLVALTRPVEDVENLQLTDIFDLEEIQKIQDAFAAATGVASIITATDGTPITRPSNFCHLCNNIIRKTELGLANCYHSDAVLGSKHAGGPKMQPCLSGGLWDGGTSICAGDRHLANWLIGQVLEDSADLDGMMEYARRIGADEQEFRQALHEVKRMPREQFAEVCNALYLIATQLSRLAVQNIQQARFITERKRAEEEVERERSFLLQVINAVPAQIFVKDQDSRYLLANTALGQLYAADPAAMIGRRDADYITDEEKVRQFIAQDRTVIEERRELFIGDESILTPGKGLRYFSTAKVPLLGPDGSCTQLLGVALDITQRKLAEEEVLRLVAAVEQAVEAMVITDHEGRISYVNAAFERILGLPRTDAMGQDLRWLDSLDESGQFCASLWPAIREGRVFSGKLSGKRGGGTALHLEISAAPVLNEHGEIGNFVIVMRDITRELTVEQQLRQVQKMEAIGTLAGGIAHDFNNVLFAILGYAEIVREDLPSGGEAYQNMSSLIQAGNRAKDLVQQILAFSRKTMPEVVAVDLGALVREVSKLLRATLPSTIELRQRSSAGNYTVLGDPTEMHQVLMNLCTNAAHAMEGQPGLLEIGLREILADDEFVARYVGLKPGMHVELSVSDSGRGMTPDVRDRIFEPFFTTKEQGQGTGMGLAVVHGIVTKLGGIISVYSEPGVGTTFRIYLPSAQAPVHPSQLGTVVIPRGTERILVVDDEPHIVSVMREMLSSLGYSVTACTSSTEALQRFTAEPQDFDLMITDQTMPRLPGIDLARSVQQLRPDLPVILCTGYSSSAPPEMARSAGIREYLMKPITRLDLAYAVRRALDRHAGGHRRGG